MGGRVRFLRAFLKFVALGAAFLITEMVSAPLTEILGESAADILLTALPYLLAATLLFVISTIMEKAAKKEQKQAMLEAKMAQDNFDAYLATMPATVREGCEKRAKDQESLIKYLNILIADHLITRGQAQSLLEGYRKKYGMQEKTQTEKPRKLSPDELKKIGALVVSVPTAVKEGCYKRKDNPEQLKTYLKILKDDHVISREQATALVIACIYKSTDLLLPPVESP